jgi:hypothetical protein
VHSWRPKVYPQMWDRYPCPPFARKMRQPGVRPPHPVSTKRELSGQHSPAAPSLGQQRAQERDRCTSKVSLHSPRVVSGLHREKTAEASARPSQRRAKVKASRNSRECFSGDAAWFPAPFGTCGTPAVTFQCMSSRTPHATAHAPLAGSVGWRRASGRKVCARNAIPSTSAGTVGARAQDLASRARSARTVSLSNLRRSHRPARALEAAAWLAKKRCRQVSIDPSTRLIFLPE